MRKKTDNVGNKTRYKKKVKEKRARKNDRNLFPNANAPKKRNDA